MVVKRNFGSRRTGIKRRAIVESTSVTSSLLFQTRVANKPKAIMKMIIAFSAILAIAVALPRPQSDHQDVVVVKETPSNNIGVGGYNYAYELSDGQYHEESAEPINVGTEDEALAVRGSYAWVDPATNQRYVVTYVADDTGFHPQGEHIPA